MVWKGSVYVDIALPFGLCFAPKLFNALEDGLSWILTAKGTRDLLHYLDNFLFIGALNTEECKQCKRYPPVPTWASQWPHTK